MTTRALLGLACVCGACSGSGSVQSGTDAGPACTPEAATSVSAQARARLGAYYFDGWTGPLSNFHFKGMVGGPYADRQPLTGWLDSSPCVVEEQLATARALGVDFFGTSARPGTQAART